MHSQYAARRHGASCATATDRGCNGSADACVSCANACYDGPCYRSYCHGQAGPNGRSDPYVYPADRDQGRLASFT
jgi:hypothetical protein